MESNKILKLVRVSAFLAIILSLIFTSGTVFSSTESNIQIVKDFGTCISKYSEIMKGKICGAYVPWGKDVSNLTACLMNPNITYDEIVYDSIGNVYEISYQLKCDTKKVWVTLGNKEHPDNLYVKSVGEIVN